MKKMLSESYNNIALAMNTKKLTLMDKLDRKSFYESRAKYESPEKLAFIEKMRKMRINQKPYLTGNSQTGDSKHVTLQSQIMSPLEKYIDLSK